MKTKFNSKQACSGPGGTTYTPPNRAKSFNEIHDLLLQNKINGLKK